MKAIQKYVLLAVLAGAVLAGCRNDDDEPCCDPTNPECPNYDPCWDKQPTAGFKMRQTSPGFATPEHLLAEWCDTISNIGVEFLADMEEAYNFSWQIGTEATTRTGRRQVINFSSYRLDTLQNLDPNNPGFYLPLNITLEVRNNAGACIAEADTFLTTTRQLVFARRSLIRGSFRGKIEGENFERDVVLWQYDPNTDHPDDNYWSTSVHIGLPPRDTLRIYYGLPPYTIADNVMASYKQSKWDFDWESYVLARDGIRKWEQLVTPSANGPDKVDLYFERVTEDNSEVQSFTFSGKRIE